MEAGLGPAGVVHDFGSGESFPVHLQQELEMVPGGEREVIKGDSQ